MSNEARIAELEKLVASRSDENRTLAGLLRQANERLAVARRWPEGASSLHGTLLLDLPTIEMSPDFFALQALMLRTAGMSVVVTEQADGKHETGFRAAQLRVPFTDARHYTGKDVRQSWKYRLALGLLPKGPVLWPDLDFGTWMPSYGETSNVPGLIILSWAAVMKQGIPGASKASA